MTKFISIIICCTLLHTANISTSPIHWGFKKNHNHVAPSMSPEVKDMLVKYNSFYLGDTTKKNIYLTFDNGYENGYTPKILDILKRKKVPATFFVTGHYLDSASDIVKRMVKEDHIVGNHSWSHPNFTRISDTRLSDELERVRKKTEELTGQSKMLYLRPPQGVFSERSLSVSKQLGYCNIFWSVAFVDWNVNSQKGWKYSYDNIMKQIHPGAVILLHAVSRDNADALERVIDNLRQQGYIFKSLDELKKR